MDRYYRVTFRNGGHLITKDTGIVELSICNIY